MSNPIRTLRDNCGTHAARAECWPCNEAHSAVYLASDMLQPPARATLTMAERDGLTVGTATFGQNKQVWLEHELLVFFAADQSLSAAEDGVHLSSAFGD